MPFDYRKRRKKNNPLRPKTLKRRVSYQRELKDIAKERGLALITIDLPWTCYQTAVRKEMLGRVSEFLKELIEERQLDLLVTDPEAFDRISKIKPEVVE